MSSPLEPFPEPSYMNNISQQRSSDEDGTIVGEPAHHRNLEDPTHPSARQHVRLQLETDDLRSESRSFRNMKSPSQTREQAMRLEDDLRLLAVEQQVQQAEDEHLHHLDLLKSKSIQQERSRGEEKLDEFDAATNPLHENTRVYKPPAHPKTAISKFFKKIHHSSFLVRYFTYIVPVVLILLIPLLVGALVPIANRANVGGVWLVWFMIWLEIVWLTLWAGRILAKCLPWPIGTVASLFTDDSKKWRDMGKELEISATLFFWWLAIEISFLPTMKNHHTDGNTATRHWELVMNKILVSALVGTILNFIEKIIIQLIAISFHQRTYADRIELNKFQIGSLIKLYSYSKVKLTMQDSDFEPQSGPGSGARTPGLYFEKAQKGTREVFHRFGDVAGKIAGDFTGRAVKVSSDPSQVILTLLRSTGGSQVLARRLYRTFAREDTETVHSEDLKHAFESQDECDAAFSMFDKDMNGDISMEELEAVCVEIGRERKAITASLKDLDSVVGKLDEVLTFVIVLIVILVLISLLSSSAAGALTSAGSTILALSWLLSATSQEFLQSLIFVFVKHPFDVGDRVTIYGNTGATLKGDDYFVKEISLLYTEFKKMEGHVVQAPNSYLNTLFILNMRRSGGLAEAISMTFKFGTTIEQIDGLRLKLLDFVTAEKREFQSNILTELRDIVEAHSINLNVVFFHKSNWQNEGLRLQRRNKFLCAMMIAMQELGIEGPRMRYPGQKETFPLYMQNIPFSTDQFGRGGHPDNSAGLPSVAEGSIGASENDVVSLQHETHHNSRDRHNSVSDAGSRTRLPSSTTRRRESTLTSRQRGESILGRPTRLDTFIERPHREGENQSIADMAKKYDFSLGMQEIAAADYAGDVYADRQPRMRIPISVTSPSKSRTRGNSISSHERGTSRASDTDRIGIGRTTSRSNTFGPETTRGVGGPLHRTAADLSHAGSGVGAGVGGVRKGSIGSIASLHKNRFFRTRRSTDTERMETGTAGIPGRHAHRNPALSRVPSMENEDEDDDGEVAAAPSESARDAAGVGIGIGIGVLDPRSGTTSTKAVRVPTNETVGSGENVLPFELHRNVSPLTSVVSSMHIPGPENERVEMRELDYKGQQRRP